MFRVLRTFGFFTFALGFLLASASAAEAANFVITGCSQQAQGRCWLFDPPVLPFMPIAAAPDATGVAQQTGSNPATLTLPPGVFNQPGPNGVKIGVIPLKGLPYLQFATSQFVASAPTMTVMFSPGPKTTRPANFSFCPGATQNPACPNGSTAGTRLGRVRYTAGANQFGGTMQSLWGGVSGTSILQTTVGPKILNSPLSLTVGPGKPYGGTAMGTAPNAKFTVGGNYTPNGVITAMGVTTGSIPGFTNLTTGFPFTTGMVVVTIPFTMTPSAFTGTGTDMRTPMGNGNITMVAGSLGFSNINGEHATMLTVYLSLADPKSLPSMGRVGFASLGALLVGVAFLAFRRR